METQEIGDTVTVKHEAALIHPSAPSPDLVHLNAASPHNSHASPLPEQRASKIAACLSCRRSKVRCEKGPDPVRCRRCAQTGGDCIRPTFNVGRRKGVKKCAPPPFSSSCSLVQRPLTDHIISLFLASARAWKRRSTRSRKLSRERARV